MLIEKAAGKETKKPLVSDLPTIAACHLAMFRFFLPWATPIDLCPFRNPEKIRQCQCSPWLKADQVQGGLTDGVQLGVVDHFSAIDEGGLCPVCPASPRMSFSIRQPEKNLIGFATVAGIPTGVFGQNQTAERYDTEDESRVRLIEGRNRNTLAKMSHLIVWARQGTENGLLLSNSAALSGTKTKTAHSIPRFVQQITHYGKRPRSWD